MVVLLLGLARFKWYFMASAAFLTVGKDIVLIHLAWVEVLILSLVPLDSMTYLRGLTHCQYSLSPL